MIDLSKNWPPGLSRQTAERQLSAFAVLLLVLFFLDHPISAWATSLPQPAHDVFTWFTQWGESDWILYPTLACWVVPGVLSFVTKDRLRAALRELATLSAFVFVGVGLPSLFTTLVKRVIGRGRPETWTVDAPAVFQPFTRTNWEYVSFPSGHATTAFALAAVFAFIWPRTFWPAILFATAIALSRVVLGAHYPTDVTAGAVVGVLGAYGVRAFFARRGWLFTAADGWTTLRPFDALRGLFRN